MDTLTNKRYESYDYNSRYSGVPYYYDTLCDREVYGIGTNMIKANSYYSHKITDGDTLDSLALKYYNNPTYWWVIAYFNDLQDAFTPLISLPTKVLKIPSIAGVEFGAER